MPGGVPIGPLSVMQRAALDSTRHGNTLGDDSVGTPGGTEISSRLGNLGEIRGFNQEQLQGLIQQQGSIVNELLDAKFQAPDFDAALAEVKNPLRRRALRRQIRAKHALNPNHIREQRNAFIADKASAITDAMGVMNTALLRLGQIDPAIQAFETESLRGLAAEMARFRETTQLQELNLLTVQNEDKTLRENTGRGFTDDEFRRRLLEVQTGREIKKPDVLEDMKGLRLLFEADLVPEDFAQQINRPDLAPLIESMRSSKAAARGEQFEAMSHPQRMAAFAEMWETRKKLSTVQVVVPMRTGALDEFGDPKMKDTLVDVVFGGKEREAKIAFAREMAARNPIMADVVEQALALDGLMEKTTEDANEDRFMLEGAEILNARDGADAD